MTENWGGVENGFYSGCKTVFLVVAVDCNTTQFAIMNGKIKSNLQFHQMIFRQ